MEPARRRRFAFFCDGTIAWLALALALLALSVAAIAVRAAGYPASVPRAVAGFLDAFVEPGAALWWIVTPALFKAFPADASGYALVALGNTAFWLIGAAVCVLAWRAGYRLAARLRR